MVIVLGASDNTRRIGSEDVKQDASGLIVSSHSDIPEGHTTMLGNEDHNIASSETIVVPNDAADAAVAGVHKTANKKRRKLTNKRNESRVNSERDIIVQIQWKFTVLFMVIITVVMVITMLISWGASYGQQIDQLQTQMRSEIRSVAVNAPALAIPDPFDRNWTYDSGTGTGNNDNRLGSGNASSNTGNWDTPPAKRSASEDNGGDATQKNNHLGSFADVVQDALENGTSIADAATTDGSHAASLVPVSVYQFVGVQPYLVSGASYLTDSQAAAAAMIKPSPDAEMVRMDSIDSFVLRVTVYGEDYMSVAKTDAVDTYVDNLTATLATVGASCIIILGVIVYAMSFAVVKPMRYAWEEQKRFIADASHELRTPIAVIMSAADAALANKNLDADSRRWFEVVRNQSSGMSELVNDLLYLAANDDGRVRDEIRENVDVSETVTKLGLQFQPVAFESGKVLTIDVASADKAIVNIDRRGFERVVSVLLDNAVKYSDTGETIRVSTSVDGKAGDQHNVDDETRRPSKRRKHRAGKRSVYISVESIGKPIRPSDADKVFDRFYRSDQSRTQGSGYGLGLSMARRIVEHVGGTIKCMPRGKVSTFVVSLPISIAGDDSGADAET